MSVTPAKLRELHRLHRQIADLDERLAQGPRRIARAEAVVAKQQGAVDASKEKLHKARKAATEQQAQLQQREARIAELKGRLPKCASNKEYQQLDEQIAADEQANDVMSVEIFERLEKLDQLEADLAKEQESLAVTQQASKKVQDEVADSQAKLQAELARVRQNLENAESDLPADFKQDYMRVATAKGPDALAEVDGGSCGGCFQTLRPQTINLLHMGQPVICGCGCVLYLGEDAELPG